MAQSKLIDIDLLERYHGKITDYIDTADSGKINKVSSPTAGDFVTVDSNGELVDAGSTIAAEDVTIVDSGSLITATNVEDALQELASASAGGVASKNIWIEDDSASQSVYAKVYNIYQCATQADEAAGNLKGTINIPKDLFIKSASVETVVTPDVPYSGAAVGDKYIDIEVQNQTDHLYVPCNSLVDEYTAQSSATQVQLAIDSNNVISATIVAASVTSTELATDAVTTAKIQDDAVTADKVAISAHSESQTAGADGLALSVTTTDGQVSSVSGSIAANTYEAYGAVTTAIEALDASESQTAGADGLALSITEVDGVITAISGSIAANTYEAYGAVASAIADLDSNTSSATDTTDSGLTVLTEVGVVDGLISTKKSHTFGSAADCADTDFLKTADYGLGTNSDIDSLFS